MRIPVQIVQQKTKKVQQIQQIQNQQQQQVTLIQQKKQQEQIQQLVEQPIRTTQLERELMMQQIEQQQQRMNQMSMFEQQQQFNQIRQLEQQQRFNQIWQLEKQQQQQMQLINEMNLLNQRKYRYTLQLEQFLNQEEIMTLQQQEQCLIAKVKPTLRVVVLKFKKVQPQQEQLTVVQKVQCLKRRIVVLPRHVQVQAVKVKLVKEQRQIRITAPTVHNIQQLLMQETEQQLLQKYPLPVEYQLNTYRLLKRLVKQEIRCLRNPFQLQQEMAEQIMVPRIVMCQQTRKHKLLLEVHTTNTVFQPEEMQVMLEPTRRTVMIWTQPQQRRHQQQITIFEQQQQQQQQFTRHCHELQLPTTFFNLEKITSIKKQQRVVIQQEQQTQQQQQQQRVLTVVVPFRKHARLNLF